MGVGHEVVAHGRDVDEPVLVDSHVHEGAEGRHVGHGSFEHHARLDVTDLGHALLKRRGLELRTRIAPGLIQLGEDVRDGGHAEFSGGVIGRVERVQHARIADELRHSEPRRLAHRRDHRIRLRVDGRGVERVIATRDAQEAG